jgi:hypothetical protein
MKQFYFFLILIMIFGVAHVAHADVMINEIAWMGTVTSTNDEWIELYNSGSTAVSLDGWTLTAADGSPSIDLVGTIAAGGYYLAERTDDTTVPGITAGVIYSGSLSNTGETLILKNNNEVTIDTVTMTSGWTAGDSISKDTMQKSGSAWTTGIPTPGVANVTGSSSGSGTGNGSGNTSGSGTTSTGTTTTTSSVTKPKTEQEYWQEYVKQLDPDPKYSARMIVPDTVVEHVPVKFSAVVKKFDLITVLEGKYEWSMGDGSSFLFSKSTPFSYTYQEAGQYVIMLRYYSNIFKKEPDTIHKKTITVIPAAVSITINSTGTIILSNNSDNDIDLGNWKLKSEINEFIFPLFTILQKSSKINVPETVHKLNTKNISLVTPNGYLASQKIPNINYKNSSINNYQKSFANNSEPETLFQESNPENESLSLTPKTLNYRTVIWIILFIVLLIGATLGMHIFIRKIESDSENEVV